MEATGEEVRIGESEEFEIAEGYADFCNSDLMRFLADTNDIRMGEELTRPRVEIWADDFEWQQWVSLHEQGRRSIICQLPSMRSSPFCAFGIH